MFQFTERRSVPTDEQTRTELGKALDRRAIERCVRACIDCELACLHLLESRLEQQSIGGPGPLIRSCIGCADACATVTRLCAPVGLTNMSGLNQGALRETLKACLLICASAEAECRSAAALDPRTGPCSRACGNCADQCRAVLGILRSTEVETEGVEVVPVAWAQM